MKRILTALILLLGPVAALNAIDLTQAFSGAEPTTKAEVPAPAALSANWWSYFNVDDTDLYLKRVRDLEKAIQSPPSDLTEEQRVRYDTLVRRLFINLEALPQAKNKTAPPLPVSMTPKDSYTLDQILTLYDEWESSKTAADEETEETQQLRYAADTTSRSLDNRLALYLTMNANTADKLFFGLEMMADRASLAISRQDIRVQKGRSEAATLRKQQLQSELELAQNRIEPSPQALLDYSQEIAVRQDALAAASRQLLQAEARSLKAVEDSPLARAESSQLQQQVLLAATREARERVQLILVQMSEVIQQLLLKNEAVHDMSSTDAKLDAWRSQLDELAGLARSWERVSEREYLRASDAFRELTQSGVEGSSELRSVMQRRASIAQDTVIATQELTALTARGRFLHDLAQDRLYSESTALVRWGYWLWQLLQEGLERSWGFMTMSLFKISDVPVTPLGLIRVIMVIIFFIGFSWLVQAALQRAAEQQWRIAKSTFYTLGRLAHYSILTLGFIVALTTLGFDFGNLALVAGALSVGIGFGLQSMVNNFLSGLIILFEKNLKIGDFLELESGYSGFVSEINVRSTVIRTNDGIEVVVPNAEIIGNKVINWTMTDAYRRMHIPFGVAYGTDKDKVKDAVNKAADNVPHTLKDHVKYGDPAVRLVEFGDSSLNFELVVWVNARASRYPHRTKADYLWEIETQLREAGITIPFPQRDLHIVSGSLR